jgi:hypothetical protein
MKYIRRSILALTPAIALLAAPAAAQSLPNSVTLGAYYGTGQEVNLQGGPIFYANGAPVTVDALKLTTEISTDLATQIANTFFDPRVTTNIAAWATISNTQLLSAPEHLNANAALGATITNLPGTAVAEFDTGPQFNETVRYCLSGVTVSPPAPGCPEAVAMVSYFERDYVKAVNLVGPPTSVDQCKYGAQNGGWKQYTNPAFHNQGECVTYVQHHTGT